MHNLLLDVFVIQKQCPSGRLQQRHFHVCVTLLTNDQKIRVLTFANLFKKREILTQRRVCVGCQLNGDQILGLLCLKGHVRVRDSTLRLHQLTRIE